MPEHYRQPEILPDLPDDVAIECLIRVPHDCLSTMGGVSKRWRDLINDPDFYGERKLRGTADGFACLVQQRVPVEDSWSGTGEKSGRLWNPMTYSLTVFDPKKKAWERLPHPDDHRGGLPLFCQLVAADGKLLVLGGWNKSSWEATRRVWVFDFRTRVWRRGKDMPSPARSFFAAGALGAKVFIAGGHDESKNALRTSVVYDVERDEWEEMGEMGEERDECEGMVVGKEFWVVSGYRTESQGQFVGSADVLDTESRTWSRVDGIWEAGKCPRCAGIRMESNKVTYLVGEKRPAEASCTVAMGEGMYMMTGSTREGGPVGCYLVELSAAKRGKVWTEVEREAEFAGFVQSGCFVEI